MRCLRGTIVERSTGHQGSTETGAATGRSAEGHSAETCKDPIDHSPPTSGEGLAGDLPAPKPRRMPPPVGEVLA